MPRLLLASLAPPGPSPPSWAWNHEQPSTYEGGSQAWWLWV